MTAAPDAPAAPDPPRGVLLLPSGEAPEAGRTVARAAAVSAAAQLAAKGVHLALNVVSTLAIVRYLAPGEYGVYVVVLTVTTLTALAADFGLPRLAVKDICAAPGDPHVEGRVTGTIVVIRLVLAVGAIGVSVLVLWALQQPARAYPAAVVSGLSGVGEAVVAAVVVAFQVRLVQHYEAWIRTVTELLETAAVVALVLLHAPLVWLFVPPAVGSALAAVAVLVLARRRFGVRLSYDPVRARALMRAALPIAPALLVWVLYRKVDALALAAFRPPEELGVYGAAAQPVEYVFLSTALLVNVAFPLLSAAHGRGDTAGFVTVYRRGTEALVLLTVALPLLLLFVAGPLAPDVLGDRYAEAALPLVLLSVAVVPFVVSVWQSFVLLLGGHQRVTLYYNLVTLAVAALASAVLVPAFGIAGAGAAHVCTAVFVMAASGRAVRRLMGVRLEIAPLLRIAGTALAAAVVLSLLVPTGLPWPLRAAVGLVAFAVAARVTGAHRSIAGVVA